MCGEYRQVLKQYFGYDDFREGQSRLIDAILGGRDVLGVMPTGAGKSICYQLPALLLPGITLVISPLISLMRDQVQSLIANGIPAAYLNSSLNDAWYGRAMANARAGRYKIIYVAPERLLSPSMLELASSLHVSMVAVDEAHCISRWGQDFRPSYLDIPDFVGSLPLRPVLTAFTATATPRVRKDILEALRQQDPLMLVTGFDRPNLYFEVKQPENKYKALVRYLNENDHCGIVYCSTRKEAEAVAGRLAEDGYAAACYHAGLSDEERSRAQDDFLHDRIKIIVATNAFGMGIDKSNVRFVVHYNMPQNVESYYQEAGRAGRDGLPAGCILFYARKDINTALFLINRSENPEEAARNKGLLRQMERYCETEACLRRFLLAYFGEDGPEDCGNCGNCNGNFDETDVTIDAQKMLSHITRLNRAGKHFMFTHTTDILLGKSEDFTDLSTYGIMKGSSRHHLRSLSNKLTALGYLEEGSYMSVTRKAREVLFDGVKVYLRGRKPGKSKTEKRESRPPEEAGYAFSESLFAKLKRLRLEIAEEGGVPAFVVFSDATLVDMCRKHPRSKEELLQVSGVGGVKLGRYGERFLTLLCQEEPNPDPQTGQPELTAERLLGEMEISDSPMQISRVADSINAVLIRYGSVKTSGMQLNRLLIDAGYMELEDGEKVPSDKGRELGISAVRRHSERGDYTQCLLSAKAQRLCAELIAAVLS